MTLTVIGSNTIVPGTAATITVAGDDLILVEGVRLVSTAGTGISVLASDTTTYIEGSLTAAGRAFDEALSSGSTRLFVGETGRITSFLSSSNDAGVVIFGSGSAVNNKGQIDQASKLAGVAEGATSVKNELKVKQ